MTASVGLGLLVAAAGMLATVPPIAADQTPTLDDAWFASVAEAESLLSEASVRGGIDSTVHAAVADQARLGVHVLGAVLRTGIAADTLLAPALASGQAPKRHGWAYRVFKTTGIISALAGLGQLVATMSGAAPGTRTMLGYVGGSAAGVSGVLDRWLARQFSSGADPVPRIRALDLETGLRASIHETEFAADLLWNDLRAMALDSCATRGQVVMLARSYVNALERTCVIIDSRMAATVAIARSCAEHPGFADESRDRCGALAAHLDAVGVGWQQRQWLIERSKKAALDYLALADRP